MHAWHACCLSLEAQPKVGAQQPSQLTIHGGQTFAWQEVMNADNAALRAETEALQLLDAGPLSQEVLNEALRTAAAEGHVAALRILLAAPVSFSNRKLYRQRALAALEAACDSGQADCAAAVLERGCLPADDCNVAVQNALRGNHSACLRVLLDRLGPANLDGSRQAADYFVYAAAEGAVMCMEELRRRGVDPRTVRRANETPLLAVCRASKHPAAAEWLCRAGADVDAADAAWVTPLMLACSAHNISFVGLLLRFGANPGRAPGGGDEAPLCRVVNAKSWEGESLRCVSLLLDHGASGHAFLRSGVTVLLSAIRNAPIGAGNFILPRLLAAGALVDNPCNGYDSPLVAAARRGWGFAVRVLCAHGAGVQQPPLSAEGSDKANALVVTVRSPDQRWWRTEVSADDYTACVDELIERGATMLRSDLEFTCDYPVRYEPGRAAVLCGLLLARVPLHVPLPDRLLEPEAGKALFPPALECALRRLDVLHHGGTDNAAGMQRGLTAAFLQRVRDACGGAVTPAYAPFARFRFVAAGGLQRAWASEREVHRFPVEHVALCRAALQVTVEAELAAAVRSVPLLQDAVSVAAAGAGERSREAEKHWYVALRAVGMRLSAAVRCVPLLRDAVLSTATGAGVDCCSHEAEMQRYVAAKAVGMWGGIKAAVSFWERAVAKAEAALEAAVEEAKGAVERLEERIAVLSADHLS